MSARPWPAVPGKATEFNPPNWQPASSALPAANALPRNQIRLIAQPLARPVRARGAPEQLVLAIVLSSYCLAGPLLKEARFLRMFGSEFEALDKGFDQLTVQESHLGNFDVLDESSSPGRSRG